MDLLNGILNGGLGEGTTSRRSGSGSAHRGGSTTTTATTGRSSAGTYSATHKTGYSSSDGSVEYHDSAGNNYTIDADGNFNYYKTQPTDTYGSSGSSQPAATSGNVETEDNDNMLLWILLPIVALVGVKLYKRNNGNRKSKR